MKKILIKAIAAAVSLTTVSGSCVAMCSLRDSQNERERQRTVAALSDFSEQKKKLTKMSILLLFPELGGNSDGRKVLFRIILKCCPELENSTKNIKRELTRNSDRLLKWFHDYWQIICAKSDVIRANLSQNLRSNQSQAVNQRQRIQLPPIQSFVFSRSEEELSQWWQKFEADEQGSEIQFIPLQSFMTYVVPENTQLLVQPPFDLVPVVGQPAERQREFKSAPVGQPDEFGLKRNYKQDTKYIRNRMMCQIGGVEGWNYKKSQAFGELDLYFRLQKLSNTQENRIKLARALVKMNAGVSQLCREICRDKTLCYLWFERNWDQIAPLLPFIRWGQEKKDEN